MPNRKQNLHIQQSLCCQIPQIIIKQTNNILGELMSKITKQQCDVSITVYEGNSQILVHCFNALVIGLQKCGVIFQCMPFAFAFKIAKDNKEDISLDEDKRNILIIADQFKIYYQQCRNSDIQSLKIILNSIPELYKFYTQQLIYNE